MTYANKLFGVFPRLHDMTEFKGTGIDSPRSSASFIVTAVEFGRKAKSKQGATFYFTLSQPG